MMLYRISREMSMCLVANSETGMGYQLIRSGGCNYIVLNAVLGLDADESWLPLMPDLVKLEESFSTEQWEDSLFRSLENASPLPFDQGYTLESGDAQAHTDQAAERDAGAGRELGGDFEIDIHGSYVSNPKPEEEFVRFSASRLDSRVAEDGSVAAGTFATTLVDTQATPSGLAAVGRYALPIPWPARYAVKFKAPTTTVIHCGTARPQFGQAGGGVEVRFQSQLPAGTIKGNCTYPER